MGEIVVRIVLVAIDAAVSEAIKHVNLERK